MRGLCPLVWIALLCGCSRLDVELFDAPRLDVPRAAQCGGRPCACSNGLDDDLDGTADGLDDGCTAARDDDEAAWDLMVSMGDCLDCAFDANEGADEGCRYPAACLIGASPMGMGCGTCGPEPRCLEGCRPLVPNGCDCFGCCAVEDGARTVTVRLGPGCDRASLDDPGTCAPCVPSVWCANPCERCERCPGRTALPSDCAPTCGDGEASCALTDECGEGQACVLGCCIASP
jgi:hypothetical protein